MASFSYPIIPTVFAKAQIEGSLQAGLRLVLPTPTDFEVLGTLKFEVRPSLGIEANVVLARAYAGISGTLTCNARFPFRSFAESFDATLNASFFFETDVLMWGTRTDWVFWETANDNYGKTFMAVDYDMASDSFGTPTPLSIRTNGVVRGWDVCMLPNGQIEMFYSFAENSDVPVNGRPYGRLDLIQSQVNEFYNITVSPIAIHEGVIVEGEEITIIAEVFNSGSLPISRFDVTIRDDKGFLQ
jgi:hypothetical protein